MFSCCFSFFFFKQKTAYEMRISDWSSDVCSSDLVHDTVGRRGVEARTDRRHGLFLRLHHEVHGAGEELAARRIDLAAGGERAGIDKAEAGGEALLEDRKSVV